MADDSFYGFEPVANLTISVVNSTVTYNMQSESTAPTMSLSPTLSHHNSSVATNIDLPPVFDNISQAFVPMNATDVIIWHEQRDILLQRIFYGIAFALISIACTIGNCTVIWIVLSHRKMRTVTNFAIAHLALADLLLGSWNPILVCQFLVTQEWLYGTALCVISNFIAHHSIALSVFTLISISIDRYMAIMRPLKSQPRSTKRLLITLVVIWLAALVISLPPLLFSRVIYVHSRGVCVISFPERISDSWDLIFNSLFMLVTYGVPMILLGITYIRIGLHLWNQEIIGNLSEAQLAQIQQKRRLVRVLVWVLISFLVCWFPYQLYFVISNIWVSMSEVPGIKHVYLCFYWLAMSSSVYNPIIYVILNKNYRRCFRSAWGWLPCIRSSRHHRSLAFLGGGDAMTLANANANNMSVSMHSDSGRSSHHSHKHLPATRTSSHEMANLSATSTFSSTLNVSPSRSPNLAVSASSAANGRDYYAHVDQQTAKNLPQITDAALLYKFMHSRKSGPATTTFSEEGGVGEDKVPYRPWRPRGEVVEAGDAAENETLTTTSQTALLVTSKSNNKNGLSAAGGESDYREHWSTRSSRQPSVIHEEELESALEREAEEEDDDVDEDCFKD